MIWHLLEIKALNGDLMVSQVVTLGQHDDDGVQCLLTSGNDLAGGQHETIGSSVTQLVAVDQSSVLHTRNPVNAAATRDVCKDNQISRLEHPNSNKEMTSPFLQIVSAMLPSV